MKSHVTSALFLIVGITFAHAQNIDTSLSNLPMDMNERGTPVQAGAVNNLSSDQLRDTQSDIPTAQLAKVAGRPFSEAAANTRSAKDVAIYRAAAPSVVLILTKDGAGSGALIDKNGDVITNYHVVKGHTDVGVVFKPTVEGMEPTRDDLKRGHVIKYDEVADLALVRVDEVPTGKNPLRLADAGDISVGADVHAIGHPKGQDWTYTTGVISQYRMGYEWTIDNIKHKADIIQTQTPISPGSSGGPLISDSGGLIGVNSFFNTEGEGLNFAIAVDEVKIFLLRKGNRTLEGTTTTVARKDNKNQCEARQVSSWRDQANQANVFGYDTNCSGKINAEYIVSDKQSDPVMLRVDRNGDGRADVMYFDFQRRGKWDLSFWDENYDGHWTLVGYHPDGGLIPSRFESYEAFQRRQPQR